MLNLHPTVVRFFFLGSMLQGGGSILPSMDNGIDNGWYDRVLRRVVSGILCHFDRLPRHIGIVMDGNRRYARTHGHAFKDGHASGFRSMSRLLAVAYAAQIPEITVYAFSIENFNRTPEEVADLMDIALTRLKELVSHQGIAQQFGVRINIIGRLELLPDEVKELAVTIMTATKDNKRAVLNLAMPYTARDDIASSVAAVAQYAADQKRLGPARNAAPVELDISESSISNSMHTSHSRPLDLLIRTSGTHRLSDFLLWEIREYTVIEFVPELWPEYSPLKFLGSILRWRSAVTTASAEPKGHE